MGDFVIIAESSSHNRTLAPEKNKPRMIEFCCVSINNFLISRPEEIRGGGLLRYCNLRVRDFTPGEVEGYEDDDPNTTMTSLSKQTMSAGNIQSYSTSKLEAVRKLEQLMCSRFFIDFSEFDRQQRKLQSYVNSHFQSEEDLKFQYLLIVGNVVDRGNVCLMANERTKILSYIRRLAVDILSVNVNNSPSHKTDYKTIVSLPIPAQNPVSHTTPFYQPQNAYPPNQYQHSTGTPIPAQLHCCQPYYPQYPTGGNSCPPGYYYLPQPHYYPDHGYYPQCEGDGCYNQNPQAPIAVCPCCQSTYVSQGVSYTPAVECSPTPHQTGSSTYAHTGKSGQMNPSMAAAASNQTMSPNSPPFIPSSKCNVPVLSVTSINVIYLGENDKLIYTAGPAENASTVDTEMSPTDSKSQS